jgi:hypothetical protein
MKIPVAASLALFASALLGCSQHSSTLPVAARPDGAAPKDLNTFGDSKDQAAGAAAQARDEHYGSDTAPRNDAAAPH